MSKQHAYKENKMSKKTIALFLSLTLILLSSVAASASFGIGVSTLAKDAPLIKTGLAGERITFTDKDMKRAFGTVLFSSITITSLPKSTEGTLLLGARRVGLNQTIDRKNLSSLAFVPASKDVKECKFSFTSKGLFGGAEAECILKFVDKINYAPEADSASDEPIWTQSGVGVYTSLSASDPEGDALEVMILEYPKQGTLEKISEDGTFRYTSNDGYIGKDSFRYCIRDEYGNYSELCRVNINVVDRLSTITFADMEGEPEYNAALVMAAEGIMSGRVQGDHTLFCPEENVSRAEFVAMAMKHAGIRADTTLNTTFFDDNDKIPDYLISYVATAARLGIVNGSYEEEAGLVFRPSDPITFLECSIILDNIYHLASESEQVLATLLDVPVWGRGAVSAMYENGIFDEAKSLSAALTRADAAEILFRAQRQAEGISSSKKS